MRGSMCRHCGTVSGDDFPCEVCLLRKEINFNKETTLKSLRTIEDLAELIAKGDVI